VIIVLLLMIIISVFVFGLFKRRINYITLEEVIPSGNVISREEGIVEYKGVQYILGTNDLDTKRYLLKKLSLLAIEDTLIVDLSYQGQIIIRKRRAIDALRRK
jgi:hypothetical protein